MNPVPSIALSGLRAAQTAMAASGHNIANALTPGFRRQIVQAQAEPAGGTLARIDTAPAAGADPAADVVGLLQGKHGFFANLAVFRSADAMTGSLLDALG